MTFSAERQAIEQKIKAILPIGGVPEKLVGFPNAKIANPGENRFIRVNFIDGDANAIEIGTPSLTRYVNVLIFQIFEPQNKGTRGALGCADAIDTAFRNLVLTAGAGKIRFYTPKIRELGDEGNGYYQINVECPYKLDERK